MINKFMLCLVLSEIFQEIFHTIMEFLTTFRINVYFLYDQECHRYGHSENNVLKIYMHASIYIRIFNTYTVHNMCSYFHMKCLLKIMGQRSFSLSWVFGLRQFCQI